MPEATPEQAALVDQFISQHWARYQPSSSAAKAVKRPVATSIQVAATPDLQIMLSNCKTGQLRGHTYIDINDLPTTVPKEIKTYSVRGRFQGVRMDDLESHGFLILQ